MAGKMAKVITINETTFSFLKKVLCCVGGRVKHQNLVLPNKLIKVKLGSIHFLEGEVGWRNSGEGH